jgi:hypothetical protein
MNARLQSSSKSNLDFRNIKFKASVHFVPVELDFQMSVSIFTGKLEGAKFIKPKVVLNI